jgi:hypothetical protein
MIIRWRKKAYRDFNTETMGSYMVVRYSHDDWEIEEREHKVETNGTSGRFTIVGQPFWSKNPPMAFDSFDDAVSFILQQKR